MASTRPKKPAARVRAPSLAGLSPVRRKEYLERVVGNCADLAERSTEAEQAAARARELNAQVERDRALAAELVGSRGSELVKGALAPLAAAFQRRFAGDAAAGAELLLVLFGQGAEPAFWDRWLAGSPALVDGAGSDKQEGAGNVAGNDEMNNEVNDE